MLSAQARAARIALRDGSDFDERHGVMLLKQFRDLLTPLVATAHLGVLPLTLSGSMGWTEKGGGVGYLGINRALLRQIGPGGSPTLLKAAGDCSRRVDRRDG